MKKLTTIDYAVDSASFAYAMTVIHTILGILLLILSITSIIIKSIISIQIHIKNKNINGVVEDIDKAKEEIEKIKDGDDIV